MCLPAQPRKTRFPSGVDPHIDLDPTTQPHTTSKPSRLPQSTFQHVLERQFDLSVRIAYCRDQASGCADTAFDDGE